MNAFGIKKQQRIILLFSFFCAGVYIVLFDFLRFNEADTPNFINAAKILFGADGIVDNQSRITKPFVLLLPGFLNAFAGISITTSMFIQNLVFFVGTGYFTAKLLQVWGFDFIHQILGVFVIYTVQPIAVLSFMLINDIAGYFFTTLALYYYFYAYSKSIGIAQYILLACICLAGVLSKESSALAMIVIGLHTAFYNKKALLRLLMLYAAILGVYIAIQIFITYIFIYDNSFQNISQEYGQPEVYICKIQQVIHSFDVYWLYIVAGIIYIYTKQNDKKFFIWASLLIIPFLFLWPTVQDRTIAVATPVFVWLIVSFMNQSNTLQKILLVCAGIANVVCSYIIYKYHVQHLLPIYYSVFTVLFLVIHKQYWFVGKHKGEVRNIKST